MTPFEQILDLARWAPSGDNTQPWRFEIVGDMTVVVHGSDTRDHCVYDLDGRPSQMALGALIENISICATAHGFSTAVTRRCDRPEERPTFEIRFKPDSEVQSSPLLDCVRTRAVQRRPLSIKPLTVEQKSRLEAIAAPDFEVIWFETASERWRVAMLLFRNAKLRLTMREAFEVHSTVIEWNRQFSEDKIPDQALGVDPLTRSLMRWAMKSWPRVEFLNAWLGGTIMPRLQLDLIPGVACAAHFALMSKTPPRSIDDYVTAGQTMQRLWLEATRLELLIQPEMTPLIFARYIRDNIQFSSCPAARVLGRTVAGLFEELFGADRAPRLVFLARLGRGSQPKSRSTRIPLSELILPGESQ